MKLPITARTAAAALVALTLCAAAFADDEPPSTPTTPGFTTNLNNTYTVLLDEAFTLSVDPSLSDGAEKDSAAVFFSEDFDGNKHQFTLVNGEQTNKWEVGTAASGATGKSAYISNDGGTSNAYTYTSVSRVHMYCDVTFPASNSDYTLTFKWKGNGEGSSTRLDYLRVFLTDTSIVPVAGSISELLNTLTTYNLQNTWQSASVDIPYSSNSRQTKRLVFSWVNNATGGSGPPAAVDDIKITYQVYKTLSYQWYTYTAATAANGTWDDSTALSGAANAYYEVPSSLNDLGTKNYGVVVTNTNDENQTATARSNVAAVTVEKPKPQPPGAPELVFRTSDTVQLKQFDGYEYSREISGNITWSDNNTSGKFTGLTAGTNYTFRQRVKETPTTAASNASSTLQVTTSVFRGHGTSEAPYKIDDIDDFLQLPGLVNANISNYHSEHYELTDDIDYGSYYDEFKTSWTPIGTSQYYFSGVFDGNNKKILGLLINVGADIQCVGLFGKIIGGTVKNLGIEGGSVTARRDADIYVGGIAGDVGDGTVKNCYVTASVTGSGSNNYYSDQSSFVGGVVGHVGGSDNIVENCYATGKVSNESAYNVANLHYAGGVVGYAGGGGVKNCAALNDSVTFSHNNPINIGRVIGGYDAAKTAFTGNIAFIGMDTKAGASFSGPYGVDSKDGADMPAAALMSGDGYPEALTKTPWVHAKNKLPGLGAAIDMPAHISGSDAGFEFDGYGTPDRPFEIGGVEDLENLAGLVNAGDLRYNGKHYILTKNIDLSKKYGADDGLESWVPIGDGSYPFSGIFDGDSNKITGLYIDSTGLQYAGLFGFINGGAVKNLGIDGGSVTAVYGGNSSPWVGGVAGYVKGTVENCYVTASVTGGSSYYNTYNSGIGGVAGYVIDGSIKNCYSTGAVTGSTAYSYAGGIVGYLYSGSVTSSYSTGAVTAVGSNSRAGGVAGNVGNSGSVTNSAALNPSVSGGSYAGRVVGYNSAGTSDGNVAFSGMTISGSSYSAIGGDSVTIADLQTAAGFPEALTEGPWAYSPGKLPGLGAAINMPEHLKPLFTVGDGSEDEPYEISAPAQLARLAALVNQGGSEYVGSGKYYRLTKDIDLSDYGEEWNGGEGWIPIGAAHRFSGIFDGNNKKITGLFIDAADIRCVGLFGDIYGGTVKNLGIEGGSVTARRVEDIYVGAIAGNVGDGTVKDCYVTASVTGSTNNSYQSSFVGGVVGHLGGNGNIVENCYATGKVANETANSSTTAYAGGVVGYAGGGGVKNCAALNPEITGGTAGRVVGGYGNISLITLSGNIAFIDLGTQGFSGPYRADAKDGEDVTAAALKSGDGYPAALTKTPWVHAKNKLPGLGAAIAMPTHIDTSKTEFEFGGRGTPDEPYEIGTVEDLERLAVLVNAGNSLYSGKSYKLTGDIDLSKAGPWTPIGDTASVSSASYAFKGVFDGNSKKITGLRVNSDSADVRYAGLFGYISGGTVMNLAIEGGSVNVQYSGNGNIFVGGVVGYLNGGAIENCYVTASVTGGGYTAYIGGVAGYVTHNGSVKNCYSTGAVVFNDYSYTSRVGGVAGYLDNGGSVTNCAALNPSVSGGNVGRVVGYNINGTVDGNVAFSGMAISDSYNSYADSGDGKTIADLKTESGFPSAFTEPPWVYEEGKLPGLGAAIALPGHLKPGALITRTLKRPWGDEYLDTLSAVNGKSPKPPRVGDKLEAGVVNGGGASFTYRWKFGGVEIRGAAGKPYTVEADYVGGAITLEIVVEGDTSAAKTAPALNEARPTKPARPQEEYHTSRSVKLVETEGMEYGISSVAYGGDIPIKWQRSAMFTGLRSNAGYYFYQRAAETKGAYASEISSSAYITTDRSVLGKVLAKVLKRKEVPDVLSTEAAAVIAPSVRLAGEFAAGPNPVVRGGGNLPPVVNFYRNGKQLANGELRIYDANGNAINKVRISDMAIDNSLKRQVGSWDLKGADGRSVSSGTYLVKGVLRTLDGRSEKVSIILGVR